LKLGGIVMPAANSVPGVDWGSVAQWVAASATFLAVLVALFKDEVLRAIRRPLLEPSIQLTPPDCQKTQLTYQIFSPVLTTRRVDCYYLRLWIENLGKMRAEKVQVFLARLHKRKADGLFAVVDDFLPMNLRWAHAQSVPNGVEIYADGISPKMGKHCDLGHVIDPAYQAEVGGDLASVPSGKAIMALDLEVQPNTKSHLIGPGTYRLDLRVAAANSTPVERTIELTITGDWFVDQERMFAEGLGVKVIVN
jgi:hypothetical protein